MLCSSIHSDATQLLVVCVGLPFRQICPQVGVSLVALEMAYLAFFPTYKNRSVACIFEFLSWKRSILKYSSED